MTLKHHKVLISNSVKISLQKQVDYIALEQREPLLAVKWLDGILEAIESLSHFPQRCPPAPENSYMGSDFGNVIRHFIYKKSFRIIFVIVENEVRILSVRHSARIIF